VIASPRLFDRTVRDDGARREGDRAIDDREQRVEVVA
jgi:hypothetical protein